MRTGRAGKLRKNRKDSKVKKKRRIIIGIVGLAVVFLLSVRIWQVNKNARIPEINQAAQGESVSWRGLEYQIVSAVLWDYDEFFEQNEEFQEYQSESNTEIKILLVEYRLTVENEENQLDLNIPIQYEYLFNQINPFMTGAMNPALEEGSFHSGDSIVVPYEIYKGNLTESQWEKVENLSMKYAAVLGTYPVKNELLITDISLAGEED